jgi:hypothetical protein
VIAPLFVVSLAFAPAATVSPLTTIAEASNWQKTGRYDEVPRLCRAFSAAYHGVECNRFGTTPEGRPMQVISVGKKGAPTLLFQGGIHAGEIDGKDAGFLFLREYLDGKILDRATMAKVRVVFVPVLNVDGHERWGAWNRPNQNGPAEMGWRVTAQNLNLNRDYAKADAPETRAMLNLLAREDPIVYMDLHVTDGANFQPDVAVLLRPSNPDAPAALGKAVTALRARVMEQLSAAKHMPLGDFYPAFVKDDDPAGGFAATGTPPRFSDAYWALRNRIGILVETHSWKDYAMRVRATHDALVAVTHELALHGDEWRAAARAAEAADRELAQKPIVLAWQTDDKVSKPIDFPGYAYTREPSPISGKTRIHYDAGKPETWHIPYFGTLVPKITVTLPAAGWYVPPAWAEVVAAKLAAHGIQHVRTSGAGEDRDVRLFRADEIKREPGTFEAHAVVTLKGQWTKERRRLAPNGLFVPVKQPLARLAAQLLEPEGPDSLASWGFFDAVFERKEYMEDYVLEDVAAKMLADPAVKAEFDRKIASDAAFAKNPRARLEFFYRKHPSTPSSTCSPCIGWTRRPSRSDFHREPGRMGVKLDFSAAGSPARTVGVMGPKVCRIPSNAPRLPVNDLLGANASKRRAMLRHLALTLLTLTISMAG